MSRGESERILGHVDGTVLIQHKSMWQFYVEGENVTSLFKFLDLVDNGSKQ